MYRIELRIEGIEYKRLEKFLVECFEANFLLMASDAKAQKLYLITEGEIEARALFIALSARLLEFNIQSRIIGDAPVVPWHKDYLINDIEARINSIALASLAIDIQPIEAAEPTINHTPYSARPPQTYKYKYEDRDVVEARKARAAEAAANTRKLIDKTSDELKERWKTRFSDEDNELFKEALRMVARLCRNKFRRPGTVKEIEKEWKASKLMMMLGAPSRYPLERIANYVANSWKYERRYECAD